MDRAFVAVLIFCLVYEDDATPYQYEDDVTPYQHNDLLPDGPQVLTCSETQCPEGSTCVSTGYYTYCECPAGKVGRDCDEDIENLTVPDAIMTTPGDPVTKRMSSAEMNQTDDTVTKRMSSTEVTQPDDMVTQRLSSTEMTQPDDTVIRMSSKEMTEPDDMVTKRSSSTAMTKPEGKTTILPNVTKAGNETEQLEDGVTPYENHDFFPDGPHVLSCSETKCPEGSTCVSDGFFTYCKCPAGKVGVNCDMEDPCLETNENCAPGMTCFGPCNPNVYCEGATGIPHCTNCIEGYTSDGCKGDVDECTEYFEDVCNNNGNCTNTNGSFYCTCFEGFVGSECDEYIEDFTEPVAIMTTPDDTVTKRMSSTGMTHPDYTVTKRMSSKEMTQLDDTVTKHTSSKDMTQPDDTVAYRMSSTSLTQPDGKKTTLPNGDTGMPSENLAPSMSYAEHPFVDFMMLTFALIVTIATPFHF
ncbi:neurogenic locus notch homolog protein 1-like isoform X2 [Dreissena polymorpha]|uniref:neurogenic locus notch homolog protein 1-like isoform X2 n=1 Tax=Dreissena polymorpha TaxID=45954 RepID=UPI002264C67B|nr:neurogenic locus notch homolog protein 1-like isoform X2 [Dreissena polymorpha]